MTARLVDDYVAAWSGASGAAVGELCHADVVCDVNVPEWRFPLAGRGVLAEFLDAHEFQPGYRVSAWSGRPTADGAVVEIECRFAAADGEGLMREVHLLRAGEGGLTEVVVYCTGPWDPATVERHARESQGVPG